MNGRACIPRPGPVCVFLALHCVANYTVSSVLGEPPSCRCRSLADTLRPLGANSLLSSQVLGLRKNQPVLTEEATELQPRRLVTP